MPDDKEKVAESEELKETPKKPVKVKAVVSPGFIAAKRRDIEIEAAKKRGGLK